MQQLVDSVQLVVAIVTAVAGLLPLYGRSENWRINRWVIALVAAVCAVALWPTGAEDYCGWRLRYIALAVLLAVLGAIAWFAQWSLRHRYNYIQMVRDDNDELPKQILGGPELTSAAMTLQSLHPEWTTQETFASLGWNPAKMWEAMPRRRVLRLDMIFEFARGVTTILALVALCAYVLSTAQVRSMYRPLTVTPAPETRVGPGGSIAFDADAGGCERDIIWTTEGPAGAATGSIGQTSGIYTPPAEIERPYDIYITAFWSAEKEKKRVTVHLRPPPDYADTEVFDIPDGDAPPTRVVVQVINQRYSWRYNAIALSGSESGMAFAKRMAADGLLSGYEDIVCIGAASRQYLTFKETEENRARERARTLAEWIRSAVPTGHSRVHALKIGRYDDDTRLPPEVTAQERQVVIVGVSHPTHDVDLLPALRKAFAGLRQKQPILGTFLDHYPESQWQLNP
jgi:hypothetical protein